MKTLFKSVFAVAFGIALFTGCAVNDEYDNPNTEIQTYELTTNKTVEEIRNATSGTLAQYNDDDIIEAYVTSSDESSNFYNSISFQTIPTDGSNPIGFSVPVNLKYFTEGFTPGRKVYIKLKGLYRQIVDGSMQIGQLYQPNPTDTPEVGRISEGTWQNILFPSATIVPENDFVRQMTLDEAASNNNLNTLVELQGVQFADGSLNRTYFDVNSGGGSTNHDLIDGATGDTEFFRVSSFAEFATHSVPSGSGTIRGVMTKYSDDFQFLARFESDIKLNNPRLDAAPPLGGTAIVYSGSFTENFESYSAGTKNFPKYINDAAIGSRYWQVTSFSGNKYIQMTSFGGNPEANRSLFIVPVDMTAANGISFQSKSGFTNGNALKVYYTTNYVPGGNITDATLVDITSSFAISPGQSSGYPTNFTNSGVYAIPAGITGNGYFVFEYVGNGNGGVTSTLQIDNIVVN